MTLFLQNLINVLALGSIFALFALGLAVVYSLLGVVNFAFGETITICGYAIYLGSEAGLSFWTAIPIGITASVAFAVATELVAFRRLRGASPSAVLFSSFAVAVIVQSLIRQRISPRPKGVRIPGVLDEAWHLGDFVIPVIALVTAAAGITAMVALVVYLQRSRTGLGLRAASIDFETARLVGVRANRVILLAFSLSGALGGLAGVLWLIRLGSVTPDMGFQPILAAFIATVIGGVGSLRGAVLGGYSLAFAQVMLTAYLPRGLADFVAAFVMLVVVCFLYFRPQGIVPSAKARVA